jgi:hypothetical protein
MASSSAVRATARHEKRRQVFSALTDHSGDIAPLSRSQGREIQRRLGYADDRTRYLLASAFTPRFTLYYDVSSDTYIQNEPSSATLFKRQSAARAIHRLLKSHVQIVSCRVDRRNRLIKNSVPRLNANWLRRRQRGHHRATRRA